MAKDSHVLTWVQWTGNGKVYSLPLNNITIKLREGVTELQRAGETLHNNKYGSLRKHRNSL